MLQELAIARHVELLANAQKIATMTAWEQTSRLDRLQRSVRVARARLGLPQQAS